MADDSSDDNIVRSVKALRIQISSMIKGPCVVQRLHGILPPGQINDIVRLYQNSDSKATFRMIECILECKAPGKWQAFIEALKREGYPYLISLIVGRHDNIAQHAKRVLQVFAPYLEVQVNPEYLVDSLRAGNTITDADVQEILACQLRSGAVAATTVLLNRLQCHLAPGDWYLQFLKVLFKKGYKAMVKEMEPDFTLDSEVMKCPVLQEQRHSQDNHSYSKSDSEERIKSNLDAMQDEIAEKVELGCILPHITSTLINDDVCSNDLLEKDKTCHSEAVRCMIREISDLRIPCKWKIFVDCLRKADYPDIANRLLSKTQIYSTGPSTEQWIIGIYNAILQSQINPDVLVTLLVAQDIINDTDRDVIQATKREHGCKRAVGVLIQRMQCRQSARQWYTVFLKTLIKCQHEDLAKLIDPDFYEKFMLRVSSSTTGRAICRPESAVCSSALEDLEGKVAQREKDIHCMTEDVQQQIQGFCNKVEDKKNATLRELKTMQQQLLSPVNRAKILFQQYRVGHIQNFDCLKTEIEKELISYKAEKLTVTPRFDFDRYTELAVITVTKETTNVCEKLSYEHGSLKGHSLRQRKDSLEYASSNTSGFLEITESKALSQNSTSDNSLDSRSSSRGSSPSPHPFKVSFREPLNDNPGLIVQQRICKKVNGHNRSSSLDDLRGILHGATRRRRTLSESYINEEQDDLDLNDTQRSTSLDDNGWIHKRDFQANEHDDKSYHDQYTEIKIDRKRRTSESNSVMSESSLFPLSTTSQGSTSSTLSFLFHVSEISQGSSSQNYKSLVLHGKHSMRSGKCLFTDVCVDSSGSIVVIDHSCGSVLIFDTITKQFRQILSTSSKYKPFKIVWFEDNIVYVLFKAFDCSSKLNTYNIRQSNKANSIRGLEFSQNVQFDCSGQITDIKRCGKNMVAACFNKHVHFIRNAQHSRVLELNIDIKDWWPNSIAFQNKYIYVFNLYSQKLYCFDTDNGLLQWKRLFSNEETIEGMTIYGTKLYVAQNRKDRLVVLNIDNLASMTIWSEDVKHPFALKSTETMLLMTQFHEGQHRINRTVKCF